MVLQRRWSLSLAATETSAAWIGLRCSPLLEALAAVREADSDFGEVR
jgi:hypothetical protein